jgi:gas vesicle protein
MDKKECEMLAIGIVSGLLAGCFLAILFAPFSGKDLRMKLDDIKIDLKDRTQRFKEPEKYSRIKV